MTNMTKKQAKLLVDEVNNRVDGYTDNKRHKHVRMSEMKPYIEEQVKA